MIDKFNTIRQNNFIKSVLVIMSGTALAQIITFSFMPIVTRIYGPEPIGVLGVFSAVVAILGPLAALTYPIAIVLPESNKKARSLVKLSLLITTIFGVVISIVFILFSSQIINLFKLEAMSTFVYLLPVFIFFTGLSQVMEQWLIRTKNFKLKAKTAVFQSVFMNVSKVGIGFLKPLSIVLIVIQTAGVLFSALLMFVLSDKTIINTNEEKSLNDIKRVAVENKDFPLYRAPQVFINAVSQGLPVLLFASLFGPAVAGFYSLGRQALNTPVQLLGTAVQDVFYPKVNELAKEKKKITPIIVKAVLGLFAIGIIPFGTIIIFGPWIFSFIFGNEWFTSGEYARWIALVSLFMLITRPIIVTIPVLKIQGKFLFIEIIGTVGKVGAIFIGVYYFDQAIYAVALFSIASILMYVYLTIHTLYECKKLDEINKDVL